MLPASLWWLMSMFPHCGCPASALCHVRVVLNLLSLLASDLMCLWLPRHYLAWLQNTEAGVLAPPWNMSLQVLESAKQRFLWGCCSDMGSACPWVAAIAQNIRGIACGWGTPNVSDSWDVRPWNPLTAFWVWGNWGLDTNIVEHSGLSRRQGERPISITLWAFSILKEHGVWVKPMHN